MPVYYDNTRIGAWKKCPRSYYFRHIRHFVGTGTATPLVFGLAWHNAMDVVWSTVGKKPDEEVIKLAMLAFEEVFVEMGLPSINAMTQDDKRELGARTPDTAMEMLWSYIQTRKAFIIECEVLSIEVPFAVPLDPDKPDLMYIGRLDKVIRHAIYDILVIEHKTTSSYKKDGGFRSDFTDDFSPNSQIDGYIHAAHMLHGNEAKAVWVDGALVHRTVHDKFTFIPIERQFEQIAAWLAETKDWIRDIEHDKDKLEEYRASGKHEDFLPMYRRNTDNCHARYGRCPYLDVCRFTPNPETRYPEGTAPDGMIVKKWEPFDVLKLEQIGLEKEDA